MKKLTLLLSTLLVSFTLLSSTAFAQDPLIGYWSNEKIKLHLKANNTYFYSVKILGITKDFNGNWSAKNKKLTLNYKLLGDHKKTASYAFSQGKLLLTQKGKTSELTKRK
jgi:peroxiredoxin